MFVRSAHGLRTWRSGVFATPEDDGARKLCVGDAEQLSFRRLDYIDPRLIKGLDLLGPNAVGQGLPTLWMGAHPRYIGSFQGKLLLRTA